VPTAAFRRICFYRSENLCLQIPFTGRGEDVQLLAEFFPHPLSNARQHAARSTGFKSTTPLKASAQSITPGNRAGAAEDAVERAETLLRHPQDLRPSANPCSLRMPCNESCRLLRIKCYRFICEDITHRVVSHQLSTPEIPLRHADCWRASNDAIIPFRYSRQLRATIAARPPTSLASTRVRPFIPLVT